MHRNKIGKLKGLFYRAFAPRYVDMRHALKLSETFSHKTCTVRIYRDLLHLWKLSPAPSCMCFLLRRLDWKTRFAKIFSSSISIVPEFVIRTTSMSHFSLSFVFIFFFLGKKNRKKRSDTFSELNYATWYRYLLFFSAKITSFYWLFSLNQLDVYF